VSDTTSPTRSPIEFTLCHDPWGLLVLIEPNGLEHRGVEVVRAFPFSAAEECVSISDSNGRELVWIERLTDLSIETRAILEQELNRRQFLPKILRIQRVSSSTEPSEWTVETDRGSTHFLLNSEEDVRRVARHGALIQDTLKVRYWIPDVRSIDARSQRILERYL
jgi:hypothetical protein